METVSSTSGPSSGSKSNSSRPPPQDTFSADVGFFFHSPTQDLDFVWIWAKPHPAFPGRTHGVGGRRRKGKRAKEKETVRNSQWARPASEPNSAVLITSFPAPRLMACLPSVSLSGAGRPTSPIVGHATVASHRSTSCAYHIATSLLFNPLSCSRTHHTRRSRPNHSTHSPQPTAPPPATP